MAHKDYLVIQNSVVTNVVLWSGDVQEWAPPSDATMLLRDEVTALVWQATGSTADDWELREVLGAGGVGFTWDGSILTTDQLKPTVAPLVI